MKTLVKNRKDIIEYSVIAILSLLVSALIIRFCPFAFAASAPNVSSAITYVQKFIAIIASVSGAIMLLYGIFGAITAHANDNGPEQQKAINKIGTGIALIVFAIAATTIPVADWIITSI